MLACRSLMALKGVLNWEYGEAAESTKLTCSIDDLLKQNHSKPATPMVNYIDLKLNSTTECGLLWLLFVDN